MTPLLGNAPDDTVTVMTYNVRRPLPTWITPPADHWPARRPRLTALLAAERPMVLGAQEVFPAPARDIRGALGDGYRFTGRGRGRGGRGEGCPIFYDSTRLELIGADQTALSATPRVAGSRTWGNASPRTLVTATFRHPASGAEFAVVNTHFDPFSQRSRIESARRVRTVARDLSIPVVVMGDLNSRAGSPTLTALLAGGDLRDAWLGADERVTPSWGTFGGYREPVIGGPRIDWIVTTEGVQVSRIGADHRRVDGRWPSDHLPISAWLRFP
ncbi:MULTISPECIES: endonuclease/exonuclease/phosphatase family protein [unclassified Microbacterium]|uniref:endonuclease/exonuclease/phosphatase family protein n=1 Tax=unclassified Microbacterium TaxID=2609290 RepID=UPI003868AA2D